MIKTSVVYELYIIKKIAFLVISKYLSSYLKDKNTSFIFIVT